MDPFTIVALYAASCLVGILFDITVGVIGRCKGIQ